jgi:hypothetical protein
MLCCLPPFSCSRIVQATVVGDDWGWQLVGRAIGVVGHDGVPLPVNILEQICYHGPNFL